MRVLLINPGVSSETPGKFFPIGLGYVATAIDAAGHELAICDLEAHPRSEGQLRAYLAHHRCDVVGIGAMVTQYAWVKWMISLIREQNPSAIIIVGNSVAASVSQMLMDKTSADILVIGEGEIAIVEILDRLDRGAGLDDVEGIVYRERDGSIRFNPPRPPIEDLDTLPLIKRDLFDIEEYLRTSPKVVNEPLPRPEHEIRALNVNTARGCRYACTFCYPRYLRKKYATRSPQSIIAEIKVLQQIYGVNYIQFTSMLAFTDGDHLDRFCDCLLEEGMDVNWAASISGTMFAKDDPKSQYIAEKAKRAGCVWVAFSVESADPTIRRAMKRPDTLEGYSKTRSIFRAAKVATLSSLVFGYPEETPESINRTIDYCISQGLTPGAGFLQVLPKTRMYEYALQNGFIPDEEEYLLSLGSFRDLHINLTGMPDDLLVRTVHDALNRGRQSVLGRDPSADNPMKTPRYLSNDALA